MAVDFWLGRLSPSTAKIRKFIIYRFEAWLCKADPTFKDLDNLVRVQKDAVGDDRYKILDLVQHHVMELRGRASYKKMVYSALRSFFAHNRADLPPDKSFSIKGDLPRVNGQLSCDNIRRIILSSNVCYQAVFLCMFQAAMGKEEIVYWSNHGLQALKTQLELGEKVIKIDLPGRKRSKFEKPYYTFIAGDALVALRTWMVYQSGETIFSNIDGGPLTKVGLNGYWIRHLRRLGLASPSKPFDRSNRTGRNVHELRDVYRTQWSKSTAKPECAEYFMGHSIDPLGYNKSFLDEDFYRKEYCRALPYLNVLSSPKPFKQVDESEVDELRGEVERLQKNEKVYAGIVEEFHQLKREWEELKKS
jgi:integrase